MTVKLETSKHKVCQPMPIMLNKKVRKRKSSIEWKYENVEADEPLDIEGLAQLLAKMIMDAHAKGLLKEEENTQIKKKKKHPGD